MSQNPESASNMRLTSLKETLDICRRSFVSVGVFSGVANLLMLVPAFYMLNIYDKAVGHNSISTLIMLSIVALFMFVVLGIMEVVRSKVLVAISTRIDKAISPRLYDITFESAVVSGASRPSAQPITDLNGLRQFLTGSQVFAFFDAPWLPVYLLVLFLFHPVLGWMGVVAALVFFGLALLNQQRTTPALQAANQLSRENTAATLQNLRNAEVAASMGMMPELRNRWRQKQDELLEKQEAASHSAGLFGAVIKTLRLAVQSSAIGVGAYLVLTQQISPGMIIAGSLLMARALQPVEQAVSAWSGFSNAREQYDRLNTLLNDWPADADKMPLPPITGRVSVQKASIRPPGSEQTVVSEASFAIQPGQTCMIIGPSGAGKSTLLRGILGLWPCAEGDIRIDGAQAYDYAKAELGPQIGYLPQSIELLDGTVAENIARFGAIDAERVVQAAQDAGVHDFILALSNGYETVIGKPGGLLSPGQRQRLALARALYGRPKLVVLDEPNSNLDDTGERALNNAVATLKSAGSTVIIVSHRRGVLKLVDTLVVLAQGKVTDAGPTQQVLERLKKVAEAVEAHKTSDTPKLVAKRPQ